MVYFLLLLISQYFFHFPQYSNFYFLPGEFWPRLVYEDFKFPWIKLHPDYIEQDDLSLIESMFKKGM